ncbi:MAG: PKD domain-containing protein, partial [Saprospiraceae bacterium]|nr:PKD domain-containing protein [Saprospiraceae bacterium]
MKKIITLFAFFILLTSSALAQLANWSNIGATDFPLDVSGQINGFCRIVQMKFHHSDPNRFYAVTAEGGLFITTDAGENWTVAPGTEPITSSCASVCIDRTNDQVIYLGTGDPDYYSNGAGVYKSTDGGVTFTATTLTNCLVDEILQHPTDAATFVAVTNKGIYKTTNNGSTWTAVTATNIPFTDMQQNTAANSLILYACTNETTPRLYRSTDFGSNWTQITSGIVAPTINILSGSRIAVTPADPNIVYFSQVGGGGMLFKSTDGGLNFTLIKDQGSPYLTFYSDDPGSSGQGNYNNTLFVDRLDPNKVWIQSQNTWFSGNGGATWTMLSKWSVIIHTDHHHLLQSPYDPSKLYSCNDGGVWLSTNGGATWTPKSNGLYAYEIASNSGKSSHTDPTLVSIGTQDNGRLYRTGDQWYTTLGGDDYDKREFDYLPNGGYIYFLDDNVRTKAPNNGTTTYGLPTTTVEAMGFNRTNTELAFMGNQNIYRTTNLSAATPTWTQISTFSKTIMAIHSCIANPDRLYVITNDQTIYVSSNATSASPTFSNYTLPTASGTRASIAAVCTNADIVYIAINNKVYRSSNGGVNWTDISAGLPNVNHRRILTEDYGGTEELAFVATNNAVYYRKASPGTWTNYSTNLPARRSPTDFSMYDDGTGRSRIRYTSYGRAVWETAFGNLRPPQANFTSDYTGNLCLTNGVVKFTDLSNGGPSAWEWSFPGGTPSTSTDPNPTVTYSTPGSYSVTLTITTGSGPYTVTQSNYITVPTVVSGGTYNVGAGGDFTTLSAAAAYWNANCINGPVVFNLTDASYPSETFPITFNANNSLSSLTIKPTGTTSISGSSASALVIINGADRVTIDGSSGNTANTVCPRVTASRNLTFTNTNAGTTSAVVWIQSNGSDGATDNTIKNCVLIGNTNTTTLFGAGSGSSTIGASSFGVGNDNNSFINNKVQKTQYGIYSGGASVVNKNLGTVINLNELNSASPNNILRTGILVKFEDNILISGNSIGNTNTTELTASHGIACGGEASGSYTSFSGSEVTSATITYNVIDNIVRSQSFGGALGIYISSVGSTTGSGPNVIANNMISRINAPTAASGNYISGITIGGGRNSNTKVYYNSIYLSGTQSNNIQSFGVMVGGSENTAIVDFRDNIIVNTLSSTNRRYVAGLAHGSPYPRITFDYNNWYASGSNFAVVGGFGNSPAGDRNSLAAWQSETGKDANSKNVLPEFISTSNPHLNTSGANNLANLIGFGTPLSINSDIDCDTRYTNPDIGADENCINPDIPTLSATANPICPGNNTTISITAGNLNKATGWYWYTGSCGGTPAGAGTSITVSPTVTTTYYVRGEGGCVTPGSCASITITVNNPAPAITGPVSVCNGGNITLDAGSGYNSYAWSNGGGNSQTATFSNITTNTTYSVTVTDAIGCVGTDTHSVTVNNNPTPAITGPTSVCSGGNVTLDAGSGYNSYAWSDGGGNSQMATFSNITATTTYSVTVTDANNCSGSDAHTVTVNANPTPAITGPTSVCSGGSITLDAGSGYNSYAWSDGGGSSQMATFSNI